jgi:PAS domain S-box-containing protein
MEAANPGIHDYDVLSGRIEWDDRVRGIWGVESDSPISYETFISGIHPDDRDTARKAVDQAIDPTGNGRYNAEYRVISRKDGAERGVSTTGRAFFDQDRAVRFVATSQNRTERRQAGANQVLLTEVLHTLSRGGGLESVMGETLRAIQRATGFDAVGLRLYKGVNCPYFEQNGFTDEFLQLENFLCALDGRWNALADLCCQGAVLRDADG